VGDNPFFVVFLSFPTGQGNGTKRKPHAGNVEQSVFSLLDVGQRLIAIPERYLVVVYHMRDGIAKGVEASLLAIAEREE
jgi:hypothetical protein